jgi:membrane protease YdiL (CAAX protease family)
MENVMTSFANNHEIKLSMPMIILLHLLPGVIILLIALVFSTSTIGINFPVYLSLMLAIIFGLIPTELGIIKFFAWKTNTKIKDILLFEEKTPLKRSVISIIIPFIFALLLMAILPNIEGQLWGNIFNFIPDWFRIDRLNIAEMEYLKITMVFNFVFNGFLGPLVEELYFRGFLLPRMKAFGKLAPLINVILFSVYHFFTPWENISRILAITPLAYSVWINKNIRIGIVIHCSLNTLSYI